MSDGGDAGYVGGGEAPISDAQFGDVTETGDIPPTNTAQNPGNGIFPAGFYPWYMAQWGGRRRETDRDLRRRKRKRDE